MNLRFSDRNFAWNLVKIDSYTMYNKKKLMTMYVMVIVITINSLSRNKLEHEYKNEKNVSFGNFLTTFCFSYIF